MVLGPASPSTSTSCACSCSRPFPSAGARATSTFKELVAARHGLVFDGEGFARANDWANGARGISFGDKIDSWLQEMMEAAGLLMHLSDSYSLVLSPAASQRVRAMSYFSDSVWSYIEGMIRAIRRTGGDRHLLVTVPRLPEDATIDLAATLTRRCLSNQITLLFKVSDVARRNWSPAAVEEARKNEWLDETGSLTSWRNRVPEGKGTSLVVLCGSDGVMDAASLADFHRCDLEVIWQAQMKRSFRSWVVAKLTEAGLEDVMGDAKDYDRLLVPLLEQGKADLLQVGGWLAGLDIRGASSGRDVQRVMLERLVAFNLPSLTRFPLGRRGASLGPYISRADEFFSYTMFLEARERDKAIKAIDKLLEVMDAGNDPGLDLDDADVKGPYSDSRGFLAGLRNYVLNEAGPDRSRLKECDFVTIIDKVLKFKKKTDPPTRDPLRRLSGGPIEVVLHAVWQTLREFHRDRRFDEAMLTGIAIAARLFKHDYESAAEGKGAETAAERTETARAYLQRLLGGVDELVVARLVLPAADGSSLPVTCRLADEEVPCQYRPTAEPLLEFQVTLNHDGDGATFTRRYAWRLPETQSYRLAEALIRWAREGASRDDGAWVLPTYHVAYFEELMRASDDEETRRVLLHCLRDAHEDARLTNLLSSEWLATRDPLVTPLEALAHAFRRFLDAASETGLHKALFGHEWTDLRQRYGDACRLVTDDEGAAESQMIGMLLRCFLIVQRRGAYAGPAWATEAFEPAALATVLHPAVLEMLEAQVLFLFSCFTAAASNELARGERKRAFAENIWDGYVDLASIHEPLVGLLYNEDLNLDTNVRGSDLIHRVGSAPATEAPLSTRLLVRYNGGSDEDDVSDTEMFRESRESRLLFGLMIDYFKLHPHARDGLSLAVFRNQDIQPIIAAIHQYLNRLGDEREKHYYVLSEERRKPYALAVTVFSESGDDIDVARWLEQWQERWEAAETEPRFRAYRSCRLSVAHRIVEGRHLAGFQRLISDSFEADIAVLYDFIGAGQSGNRFAEVLPLDRTARTLKFPILGKPCVAVRHPTDSFKRSRVISNRQFILGTLHSQVMHRLKNQGVQAGKEFVVLGAGDFAPWRGVIDALHQKAEWVVCVDPSMDERLIRIPGGNRPQEREIVGFGSGVGSHGEANFTISTEQFSLADVRERLSESIREVYGAAGWSGDECRGMATGLLREARELSGLSLVRATGVGEYIRDFLAYTLTRRMLRASEPVLCDSLVSLDAYRHWFDLAESQRRPDLLWLTAWLDGEGRIRIRAHLIECKVAARSEEHLIKARTQITNGLRVLVSAFAPRRSGAGGDDETGRPDQRYWWLQLHRLVASTTEVDVKSQAPVLSALERLADGDFLIEWAASVFAFWSDDPGTEVQRVGSWYPDGLSEAPAEIFAVGERFVHRLALEGGGFPKTWDAWVAATTQGAGNICDVLDDVELPPGDDEDADVPSWNETVEDEPVEDSALDTPTDTADLAEIEEPPPVVPGDTPPPAVSPHPLTQPDSESSTNTDLTGEMVEVVGSRVPQRILLGKTVGGAKPVYWEFGHRDLPNRHMVLFGTSGMGKTYAVQCLLCELAREGQNSFLIDYTDGFVDSRIEPEVRASLKPLQHYIRKNPLPINPFKAQISVEEGIEFPDSPNTIAKRVAAIFKSVYTLGDQQFSVVIDAISEGVKRHGDSFTLDLLQDVLQGFADDGIHNKTRVQGTMSKLRPFIDEHPFIAGTSDDDWRRMFDGVERRCHVFQFLSVDRHTSRALIEFVLWDLYAFVRRFGNTSTPRVVVLDEVQNLDLGADAPVAKYLTEGRKFGLSLITATQSIRAIGGMNDARISRLFQAEQTLFFKPSENELKEHAQLLHNSIGNINIADWTTRLASLQIGECWSLGRSLNESSGRLVFQAQRIKISSLEERGFHA